MKGGVNVRKPSGGIHDARRKENIDYCGICKTRIFANQEMTTTEKGRCHAKCVYPNLEDLMDWRERNEGGK